MVGISGLQRDHVQRGGNRRCIQGQCAEQQGQQAGGNAVDLERALRALLACV
jgi:hypothetical protein